MASLTSLSKGNLQHTQNKLEPIIAGFGTDRKQGYTKLQRLVA